MTSTKSPGNSLALEPTGIDMYKTVYRESKFVPIPSIYLTMYGLILTRLATPPPPPPPKKKQKKPREI